MKISKLRIAKWKVNRKLWIKALRSNKYKQGTGQLLDDGGNYCCLGVLCDIIGMQPKYKDCSNYFGNDSEMAPYSAVHAVGLSDQHGTYEVKNDADCCLTTDNDIGITFPEIADLIEKEPKGLFRENK